MCGIVGYIGHREAYEVIIKGLKRLEYRGYDSAGIALLNDKVELAKTKSILTGEDVCDRHLLAPPASRSFYAAGP